MSAYRADLARVRQFDATEQEQGLWIMVSSLVDHASMYSAADRKKAIDTAVSLVTESMGAAEVERGLSLEPPSKSASRDVGVVRLLIDQMVEAGALEMARGCADALISALRLSAVDEGRLIALRARMNWKMGELQIAEDQYTYLDALGTRKKEPELVVRAWIGYVTLAQLKGNYPRMRECANTLLEFAGAHSLPRMAKHGHHGLTIANAMLGDFDSAIRHAWEYLGLCIGDSIEETRALTDLGQLLVQAGEFHAARSALVRSVGLRPRREVLLPAVGGLAVASANCDDHRTVRWVARELRKQVEAAALPYELAVALHECAVALHIIGDVDDANASNEAAHALAVRFGFHETTFKSEALAIRIAQIRNASRRAFSPEAADIIGRVERLDQPELPDHLSAELSSVS
jgi:tetratricopeptide (TPR) repeat protein